MSVYIKFEPGNGNGLVAEGTCLWDAAKRLGVQIPADCKGLGECDTCSVIVKEGASLLSAPTSAELERLGEARLAANERLACQTRVERGGELVVRLVPVANREKSVDEAASEFRKEFRELPLKRKFARLVEFEATTAFETLSSLASLPFTVGEKVLDAVAGFERRKREREANSPEDSSTNHASDNEPVDGPVN